MKKMTLKKLILSLAMMVLVMGTFVACGNNEGGANNTENNTEKEGLQLLPEEEIEGKTFKLGDVFADMTVTAVDGTTYKLSEILKEKKAVVLNFWYTNCGPCQMEFPYMQEAYETYQDKLEILAVDTYGDRESEIADFQKRFELTFPMAALDSKWERCLRVGAYPTTVVIDRYGIVSFSHTGMITEVEEFNKLFEFFTSETYEQTVIKNISDIQ